MKLVWTEFAIENLKIIFDYYASKASRKVQSTTPVYSEWAL
ncbi:hypothetical protein [uncultured Chryseobacterium sp.]|nr:hypothetical protein [uncultured Chryseobacterium sp.]